jgi:DNA invertase Pin-like site-specific DNA recombinase
MHHPKYQLWNLSVGSQSCQDVIVLSATGRLHFQILAIFAEFERSLISDRTRLALRRKKEVDGVTLGRPVGSKDKKSRRKSGYILRHAREKQESASQIGIHKPIQDFIDKQ